jgi:hypothetical protein
MPVDASTLRRFWISSEGILCQSVFCHSDQKYQVRSSSCQEIKQLTFRHLLFLSMAFEPPLSFTVILDFERTVSDQLAVKIGTR